MAACVDSKDAAVFHGPWQRRVGERVVAEGRYDRGKKVGVWRTWFEARADGTAWAGPAEGLASLARFEGGREDGEAYSWRADGSALGLLPVEGTDYLVLDLFKPFIRYRRLALWRYGDVQARVKIMQCFYDRCG